MSGIHSFYVQSRINDATRALERRGHRLAVFHNVTGLDRACCLLCTCSWRLGNTELTEEGPAKGLIVHQWVGPRTPCPGSEGT